MQIFTPRMAGVEIDHGNGLVTRYAHGSGVAGQEGDLVVRGQRISRVGSTGRSPGHICTLRFGSMASPEPGPLPRGPLGHQPAGPSEPAVGLKSLVSPAAAVRAFVQRTVAGIVTSAVRTPGALHIMIDRISKRFSAAATTVCSNSIAAGSQDQRSGDGPEIVVR